MKRLILYIVSCTYCALAALGIDYPYYYCSDEAFSYSLPPFCEEVHTYGRYQIGDFYYDIINEEKAEVALVTREKVVEREVGSEVACIAPSVNDWPYGNLKGDIEIPEQINIDNKVYTVVMIGYGVFYGCTELRSVKIPKSVRFISSYIFAKCNTLQKVYIPDGAYLAPNTFANCSYESTLDLSNCKVLRLNTFGVETLETLMLPQFIGESYDKENCISRLTLNCTNLRDIWIKDALPPNVAVYPENYKNITLHVPKGSLEQYKADMWWGVFGNIVEYEEFGIAGVESVATPSETSEYYDIQGHRVEKPEQGIYIRRQGDKVEKVIIR